MTIPLALLIVLAVPQLIGWFVMARVSWLVVKHIRKATAKPVHPLAMRQQPANAHALLDEPPTECPTCKTPMVSVRRAEFTPKDEEFKLLNTEHFGCENGHVWMGPNQTSLVQARIEARRKLQMVMAPPEKPSEATRAKLSELDALVKLIKEDKPVPVETSGQGRKLPNLSTRK